MIIRTLFEALAIACIFFGIMHEDFLIAFEHACYVRIKHYFKTRRMAKNETY